MLGINVGDVVLSTKGRDVDQIYIVKSVEDGYAYLVDGRGKTISKPKKKKFKHIRPTGQKCIALQEKFETNAKVLDSEIRKTIDNLNII